MSFNVETLEFIVFLLAVVVIISVIYELAKRLFHYVERKERDREIERWQRRNWEDQE